MNHFSIFAHGDKFNVDEFLARSALRPDYVWRRGDQRSYACVESKHETSGVEFALGNGWEVPFQEQEDIAARLPRSAPGRTADAFAVPGSRDIHPRVTVHLQIARRSSGPLRRTVVSTDVARLGYRSSSQLLRFFPVSR